MAGGRNKRMAILPNGQSAEKMKLKDLPERRRMDANGGFAQLVGSFHDFIMTKNHRCNVCGENFDSIFAYKTHQKDKHGYLWCENDCKVAYPAKEKHECTASLQFVFKCPHSTCPIVKNAPEFLDHCAKQHMTSLGEKTMKDILTEGQYFVRSDQIDEYVQQLDKFPSLPVKTAETRSQSKVVAKTDEDNSDHADDDEEASDDFLDSSEDDGSHSNAEAADRIKALADEAIMSLDISNPCAKKKLAGSDSRNRKSAALDRSRPARRSAKIEASTNDQSDEEDTAKENTKNHAKSKNKKKSRAEPSRGKSKKENNLNHEELASHLMKLRNRKSGKQPADLENKERGIINSESDEDKPRSDSTSRSKPSKIDAKHKSARKRPDRHRAAKSSEKLPLKVAKATKEPIILMSKSDVKTEDVASDSQLDTRDSTKVNDSSRHFTCRSEDKFLMSEPDAVDPDFGMKFNCGDNQSSVESDEDPDAARKLVKQSLLESKAHEEEQKKWYSEHVIKPRIYMGDEEIKLTGAIPLMSLSELTALGPNSDKIMEEQKRERAAARAAANSARAKKRKVGGGKGADKKRGTKIEITPDKSDMKIKLRETINETPSSVRQPSLKHIDISFSKFKLADKRQLATISEELSNLTKYAANNKQNIDYNLEVFHQKSTSIIPVADISKDRQSSKSKSRGEMYKQNKPLSIVNSSNYKYATLTTKETIERRMPNNHKLSEFEEWGDSAVFLGKRHMDANPDDFDRIRAKYLIAKRRQRDYGEDAFEFCFSVPYYHMRCYVCNDIVRFAKCSDYLDHIESHNKFSTGNYCRDWSCILCSQVFYNKDAFESHLEARHNFPNK